MKEHDLDAILSEIDAFAKRPMIQPGDVTIEMLRERWGVSDATVKDWMADAVAAGEYETLKVYDPAIGRSRRVWRKRRGDTRRGGAEGGDS